MLAALRVAPLLPSPTLRAAATGPQVGTGKQAHQSNWKAEFAVALLGAPPVMHFYSGPPMHLLSRVDRLAGAGVKLGEFALKRGGIKLEEDKAYEGAGGGGKLKIVPYVVRRLSFGAARQDNVPGLYDGPFPWQNMFGFYLAGMVGHDFFKRYAVTFDFQNMRIFLQ